MPECHTADRWCARRHPTLPMCLDSQPRVQFPFEARFHAWSTIPGVHTSVPCSFDRHRRLPPPSPTTAHGRPRRAAASSLHRGRSGMPGATAANIPLRNRHRDVSTSRPLRAPRRRNRPVRPFPALECQGRDRWRRCVGQCACLRRFRAATSLRDLGSTVACPCRARP